MNPRTIRWLVWSAVAVSFILVAGGMWLQALTGVTEFNLGLPIMVAVGLFVLALTVIGAVIATWHPHNLVGWLLFANVFTSAPQLVFFGLIAYWQQFGSGAFPGLNAALVWLSWTGEPFMLLILTLLFLHFPNGRLPSRRWRFVAWAAIAGLVGTLILNPFKPGEVDPALGMVSPFAADPTQWEVIEPAVVSVTAISLASLFASAASLILRYRRSRGVERQQLKWIAFSAVPVILTFPLPGYFDADFASPELFWSAIAVLISFFGMALAIALAIFRYRLYDIDLIINRSLVYGALSITLAAVYFISVAILQNLIRLLVGQQSPIAIVASTLVVAALFHPLRRRLQRFIDRRFYRARYDGAQMLEHYARTLSGAVEVDSQAELLLFVVGDALQPQHTSMWIRTAADGGSARGQRALT